MKYFLSKNEGQKHKETHDLSQTVLINQSTWYGKYNVTAVPGELK